MTGPEGSGRISRSALDRTTTTKLSPVRRTCEKPGCGLPTAVVYGMEDGRDGSKVLWIEAVRTGVPARPEAQGARCVRHAETITAPMGWVVDDRRESVPRLFKPKPDQPRPDLRVVPTQATPKSRRERVGDLPRPRLFSEVAEPVAEPVMATIEASPAPSVAPSLESSPEPSPAPMIESSVEEAVTEVAPAERTDDFDSSGGVERDDSKSWVPFFDPDDDLDGMLNATGSMLRDAFRSRHNGRGRDQ